LKEINWDEEFELARAHYLLNFIDYIKTTYLTPFRAEKVSARDLSKSYHIASN